MTQQGASRKAERAVIEACFAWRKAGIATADHPLAQAFKDEFKARMELIRAIDALSLRRKGK